MSDIKQHPLKILFLTSRFPYPLEKGDKLRAYYQIREISKDHDVYLISIVDDDPSKSDLEKIRPLVKELHIIRIASLERIISLIKAFSTGIPYQIAWFYSAKIHQIIQDLTANIQPDHIFCQLTRMAEYCKDIPVTKTLDYMDSFGIGMKRRANVAKGFSKYIYNMEASRMIRYEATIADKFDHLTIISEQDKAQFSFPKASDIHILHNGIDPSFFEFETQSKEVDIVFVGNMGYLPNIEAAEFLVNNILPKCGQSVTILLAGTSPAPRVKALQSDKVSITGWIEDIRVAYGQANIFVAPLWSGTGQQNKILEAMAMGIPCITTTVVNNAIGAKDGEEILLADDEAQFAEKIDLLLNNDHLRSQISQNAKIFVKQNFDWKQNGLILSSIFTNKQ